MAKCGICGAPEGDSETAIGDCCELNFCENCEGLADSTINTMYFCYNINQLELGNLELKPNESYTYEDYQSVGLIGDAEMFYITCENQPIYFLVKGEQVISIFKPDEADDDAAYEAFSQFLSE